MNFRRITVALCPPVLLRPLRWLRRVLGREPTAPPDPPLFGGDERLFVSCIQNTTVYGEYGVGASTTYVLENSDASIVAVDTSAEWVDHVLSRNDGNPRLSITWVDLGPVGNFGRPAGYDHRTKFRDYVSAIWNQEITPDLVLIDGRFRVACFLFSVLEAPPGTTILFDDYNNRPRYHVVEEILRPASSCGRQALFIVPANIDRAEASVMLEQFLMVMD